jgi:hypothetical protein
MIIKSGKRLSKLVLAIGVLSAGTLTFETALTRFLAVAQFYHFAFLIVSLALLGFGASGTLLSLFPRIKELPLAVTLSWVGIGFAVSVWITFGVVNWLPFDSYSIAWDKRQIVYLLAYYFSLSLPFLVSGLGLGTALAVVEKEHNLIYAASLVGSGLGVALAPAALSLSGVLGVIILCGLLGIVSSMFVSLDRIKSNLIRIVIVLVIVVSLGGWSFLTILNLQGRSPLGVEISPYKGLAYARNLPRARSLFGQWSAASRVDVLADAGTRRMPGLSYVYSGTSPQQHGMSVDGEALQPITLTSPADFSPVNWLPEWWAFSILSKPDILVLEPGAGFGLLQALAVKPASVSTVASSRLVVESVRATAPNFSFFDHAAVGVYLGNQRAYLEMTDDDFDLIYLPLTDSYQPVTNGVYSISENYALTTEGIAAGLKRLTPEGVYVSTRWLQSPPSESLRLVSTFLVALEGLEVENPPDSFVIYRGIQTLTVVVKPAGWENSELESLREFLDRCRFDMVWAPDLEPGELNRWNQLGEPIYYQEIYKLFQSPDKKVYYQSYPFNVEPPRDNQPFFFHFFTWRQAPQVLETLGKTWQPFGGSGFFLLFFLLAMVILLSTVMILLPLVSLRKSGLQDPSPGRIWVVVYFGLIGFGFMFLEITLISQWGLFLNTPIAAFTLVVGSLLLYSGAGSIAANRSWWRRKAVSPLLVGIGAGWILFCVLGKDLLLSWPLWIRYLMPILGLAPIGFILGTFFPRGLSWIKGSFPELVPWAWAINGSASVVASVLTALLSLQMGYSLVIILGGLTYIGAWMILRFRMS